MTPHLSPKAIAYIRVSTEEQANSGLGIDAQRATVTTAAARLGLTLWDVLVDAGRSGALSLSKRPVLLQAVSAVQRGDVLLVAKRDRLARDSFEVAVIERDVNKHGGRVVSAAGEGTDNDSPESVLFRGIIDGFAQYERSIGRVRTTKALAAKRARGERCGTLPFGYTVAPGGAQLVVAPAEQRIMARMRELQASGLATRQIAEALRQDGMTTRRGTPIRFQYVARVLRAKAS